eukprot:4741479-Alexandrium_andersonii.AAC.1
MCGALRAAGRQPALRQTARQRQRRGRQARAKGRSVLSVSRRGRLFSRRLSRGDVDAGGLRDV